jgi:hypothetical protein
MPYSEFQANWELFSRLVDQVPVSQDEHINALAQLYIKQNIILLNDVFSVSLNKLKKLQNAKSPNDIICAQARFANEINKRISLTTQNFLNTSLGQSIGDYDKWLQAHCDLSTD